MCVGRKPEGTTRDFFYEPCGNCCEHAVAPYNARAHHFHDPGSTGEYGGIVSNDAVIVVFLGYVFLMRLDTLTMFHTDIIR